MKPRSSKSSTSGSGCSNGQLFLLFLVGLFTFCAQLLDASEYNTTVAAKKVGTCPENTEVVTTSGNCTAECQLDTDCEGTEKCCPSGCGTSCQTPDEKPGSCPSISTIISPLGFCTDTCQKDSQCTGDMKCCTNGCRKRSCTNPVF